MIFVATTKVPAQDVDIYDEMTWYLKKSVVLDAARSQGRQVFFVWGRTTCAYTNGVRKNLAKEPLRSIVNEHYILWFADYEKYKRDSPEVSDYLSGIPSSVTFPAICIIDTFDVKVPHDLRLGPQNVDVLQEMLINHVSNDYVAETGVPVKVYVSGNQLIIENEVSDEMVRIFSIDGSLKG
jgi:thioredoxin-related protein